MKYAICNEVYGDWNLEQVFAHASAVGYSGIEIAPFTLAPTVDQITDVQIDELCKLSQQHDVKIVGLHWLLAGTVGLHLTSPDREIRTRTGEYLVELAKLCHRTGGQLMVFGSPKQRNLMPGVTHDQAMNYAAETFHEIVPALEQLGVTLAVEPLGPEEGDFLNTASSVVELIGRIDSPLVRLHLDVKAMSTESQPIPQIIREHGQWLAHFHANDPNRLGPGMGDVDFAPILTALNAIDYRGWISVEVFDFAPGVESLTRDSINYLKAFEH